MVTVKKFKRLADKLNAKFDEFELILNILKHTKSNINS